MRYVLPVTSGFIRIAGKKRDLVALRVAKVADIEVRTVSGTKARRALVGAAGVKRRGVKIPDLFLAARLESDHGPVAR